MSATSTATMAGPPSATFMTLPPEIRDMIYAHFPHKAWISINHTPTEVQQPTIAHVSRQVRREALAVFYSRNHFVLDLRGWKDAAYPKLWTPVDIFESWIYAIGDANAEYLRSLMIFAANFRLILKISRDLPVTIEWKVRVNTKSVDLAEWAPPGYNFNVATERVKSAFGLIARDVEATARNEGRHLTAEDINRLKDAVANLQPFLCSRMCLGFKHAYLEKDDMPESEWPDLNAHLEMCDDCRACNSRRGRELRIEDQDRADIINRMKEAAELRRPVRPDRMGEGAYNAAVEEGRQEWEKVMQLKRKRKREETERWAQNKRGWKGLPLHEDAFDAGDV